MMSAIQIQTKIQIQRQIQIQIQIQTQIQTQIQIQIQTQIQKLTQTQIQKQIKNTDSDSTLTFCRKPGGQLPPEIRSSWTFTFSSVSIG